jgi:nucleolin
MVLSGNGSLLKANELSGSDLGGFSLFVDVAKPRPDNKDDAPSNRPRPGGRFGERIGSRHSDGRRGRSFGRAERGGRGERGHRGGRNGAPVRQSVATASTGNNSLLT